MVGSEGKRGSCGCVGARNSGLFPLLGSRSAHLSSSTSPWLQTAASFSLTRLLVEPTLVEIPLEKTPVEISFTGDHTCCEKLPRENFHVRIKDHAVPACFLIIRIQEPDLASGGSEAQLPAPGRGSIRKVNGTPGDRSPPRANHLGGQLLEQII